MNQEEQVRKELEDEIFNGVTPESDDPPEDGIQDEQPVDDPWESVPSVIKDEIDGLRGKLSSYEQMEYRLKQAESRLGGVLNELHTAKEAAKQVKDSPSQKQIDDAAGNQASWDALKEDFSEWAEAIEYKIAKANEDVLSKIPVITPAEDKSESLRFELLSAIVSLKHPDWEEVNKEDDFNKWREDNKKFDSWKPSQIIEMMDEYKDFKAGLKSPREILESRKQRLGAAEIVKGKPIKSVKSEEDMSYEELRQLVANEVFSQ